MNEQAGADSTSATAARAACAVPLRAVPVRAVPAHAVPLAWQRVKRLLAVRADNLGDVLMTTPALAACAETLRLTHLALLTSPQALPLGSHLPMVDELLPARVSWVRHEDQGGSCDDAALIAALASRRFDAAVIFTTCTQSALPAALLCRLAGIPLRLAHNRENPYNLLTDWAPERDLVIADARHEVRRQLDLVAHIGARTTDERLRFVVHERDRRELSRKLAAHGLDRGFGNSNSIGNAEAPIVVHVGASAPSRRYPARRFGEAAQLIAGATDRPIIYTGSTREASLIHTARSRMRNASISLAGELNLGELGALLERAALMICNNTGPAHLACAVGTPVIDLYALTNPQHTPWQAHARVLHHDVPCRNCLKSRCPQQHHACLNAVKPEAVAQAAVDLLASVKSQQPTWHVNQQIDQRINQRTIWQLNRSAMELHP